MAHQSLYRKYRPYTFKDVAGQDQVIVPLQAQIEGKSVGHAYLFAGSRGLGKTSIARIFARELGTQDSDLYEIDAASNNSVDDIRALTENVYTLPFASPYKVYILDEAHMLSKGAWNAFLKTLEEPPAHALFILATTELDKVPETVQSRCQVFQLRKPTRSGLASLVTDIAKKEGYSIEPAAADLLSLMGDGSYRDALSMLEKALASATGKKLTLEETEQATGAPKHSLVYALVLALSSGNTEGALTSISKAAAAEVNMNLYLTLILERMRLILLTRHASDMRTQIKEEVGAEEYADIEKIASSKESVLTHQTLRIFIDAAARIRFSPIPQLPLELAVLEATTGS
ncbi:MAG: DNA polymerase III, subunit gamma and tau [Parcubacteria bacterium C7867-007]|nr:MAG: DNA polymerase III, subunit gamma and tau [Parcubacteria bacterium C7867-007]